MFSINLHIVQALPVIVHEDINLELTVALGNIGVGRRDVRVVGVWFRFGFRLRLGDVAPAAFVDIAEDSQLVAPHGDADILGRNPAMGVRGTEERAIGAIIVEIDAEVRVIDVRRRAEERLRQNLVRLLPKRIGVHQRLLAISEAAGNVGKDIGDVLGREVDMVRQVLGADDELALDTLQLDGVVVGVLVVEERVGLKVDVVALGIVEVEVGGGRIIAQRPFALQVAPDRDDVRAER